MMHLQKKKTNNKIRFSYIQLSIIVFIWILLLAVPVLFGNYPGGINWKHIFHIWTGYGFMFILFLINRLVLLPCLFFRKKRAAYFLIITILIGVFLAGMTFRHNKGRRITSEDYVLPPPVLPGKKPPLHPSLRQTARPPAREAVPPYANLLILSILIIGFDTGLNISIKWLQSEQKRLQLEKENTENKMAFLHNQISPHFFMNTLNNIHALADINKEETKSSIIRLSRLMGYLLYETQTDKIQLLKEIHFVKSYIELMQLRYSDKVIINLKIPDHIPEITIPPLLFISFIENAFKHGISYQKPSFVKIKFSLSESRLFFEISNSKHSDPETEKFSGIGISNTRNRLDLLYGRSYFLDIDDQQEIFEVKLEIPI